MGGAHDGCRVRIEVRGQRLVERKFAIVAELLVALDDVAGHAGGVGVPAFGDQFLGGTRRL